MNMMPGGWSHLGHESGAVPKQHPNNGGVCSSGGAGGKAAERVALVPVPLRESGAGSSSSGPFTAAAGRRPLRRAGHGFWLKEQREVVRQTATRVHRELIRGPPRNRERGRPAIATPPRGDTLGTRGQLATPAADGEVPPLDCALDSDLRHARIHARIHTATPGCVAASLRAGRAWCQCGGGRRGGGGGGAAPC
eukprot:scaffold5118_cov118-Isochrysis_galbana.AAC.1